MQALKLLNFSHLVLAAQPSCEPPVTPPAAAAASEHCVVSQQELTQQLTAAPAASVACGQLLQQLLPAFVGAVYLPGTLSRLLVSSSVCAPSLMPVCIAASPKAILVTTCSNTYSQIVFQFL